MNIDAGKDVWGMNDGEEVGKTQSADEASRSFDENGDVSKKSSKAAAEGRQEKNENGSTSANAGLYDLQAAQLYDDGEQEEAVEEAGDQKVLQVVQRFRCA